VNGLETVFSFGISNPLKKNVDRKNASLQGLLREEQFNKDQLVVLKQSESELKESQKIFQELKNIEIVINDYQNILTNISRELEEAESEGNRLEFRIWKPFFLLFAILQMDVKKKPKPTTSKCG